MHPAFRPVCFFIVCSTDDEKRCLPLVSRAKLIPELNQYIYPSCVTHSRQPDRKQEFLLNMLTVQKNTTRQIIGLEQTNVTKT